MRLFGIVLFIIGVVFMFIAVTNVQALGWFSLGIFLGGFGTSGLAVAAIYTGNPEWVLLDIILPG